MSATAGRGKTYAVREITKQFFFHSRSLDTPPYANVRDRREGYANVRDRREGKDVCSTGNHKVRDFLF